VRVPKGEQFGPLPKESVVVLETKGAKPRRIRIPIQGNGQLGR
jgi:hypothetical protein